MLRREHRSRAVVVHGSARSFDSRSFASRTRASLRMTVYLAVVPLRMTVYLAVVPLRMIVGQSLVAGETPVTAVTFNCVFHTFILLID